MNLYKTNCIRNYTGPDRRLALNSSEVINSDIVVQGKVKIWKYKQWIV